MPPVLGGELRSEKEDEEQLLREEVVPTTPALAPRLGRPAIIAGVVVAAALLVLAASGGSRRGGVAPGARSEPALLDLISESEASTDDTEAKTTTGTPAEPEEEETTAATKTSKAEAKTTTGTPAEPEEEETTAAPKTSKAEAKTTTGTPAEPEEEETTAATKTSKAEGTTAAPTEPTRAPPEPKECSQVHEDCSVTKCCADSTVTCFRKNDDWAGCRRTCDAGENHSGDPGEHQTPWTCEVLEADQQECSLQNEDCIKSRCCQDEGYTCYEKDQNWAACRQSCDEGENHSMDPSEHRTPWSCKVLTPITATPTAAPTPLVIIAAAAATPQVVKMKTTISGVDYAELKSNDAVRTSLESNIKTAVCKEALVKNGCTPDSVSVTLSAGSVIAETAITTDDSAAASDMQSALADSTTLNDELTAAVADTEGIDTVSDGETIGAVAEPPSIEDAPDEDATPAPTPSKYESARLTVDENARLLLATTGHSFRFTVEVNASAATEQNTTFPQEILVDAGSALFLRMPAIDQVELTINMYNDKEATVSISLKPDGLNIIGVSKSNTTLCLGVAAGSEKCVKSGSQMKLPGMFSWGLPEGIAQEYIQVQGSVPLSLKLSGLTDSALDNENPEYQVARMELDRALKSSIALVAGFGVSPSYIFLAYSSGFENLESPEISDRRLAEGDIQVQASVVEIVATAVQAFINLESNTDELAAEMNARIGQLPSIALLATSDPPEVTASNVVVPPQPVECKNWQCSKYQQTLQEGTCLGASCDKTCCAPTTCTNVECHANYTRADPNSECNGQRDCIMTCCATTCQKNKYGCPVGTCPVEANEGQRITIGEYDEFCCEGNGYSCCKSDIAECWACQLCMTPTEVCEAADNFTNSPGDTSGGRRLRGDSSDDFDPSRQLVSRRLASSDRSQNKRRPWWRQSATRVENVVAKRERQRQQAEVNTQNWKDAAEAAQIQNVLDSQAKEERMELLMDIRTSQADDIEKVKKLFVESNLNGSLLGCNEETDIPICPYKEPLHFQPKQAIQPQGVGKVTAVAYSRDGTHILVGNSKSTNLYQISSRTGQPNIPGGRTAEGVDAQFGAIQVGPQAEGVFVTAAIALLDGQHSAVAYSDGVIQVFNSGDINYPPDFKMPGAKAAISGKVNALAGMPSWKMMLVAMDNSFTLAYQWASGGVIRYPRNVSTRNETIAKRQQIIKKAFNEKFSKGSYPPTKEQKEEFYKNIAEQIKNDMNKIQHQNEAAKASWQNENNFGEVNDVEYVPINTRFVTAHADGRVRYWDSNNGNLLAQMAGHEGPVNALAVSPAAEIVASGGDDGTVRVWDFTHGKNKQIYLFDQKEGGKVLSLTWVPGGTRFIVAGSEDGQLRRYDLDTGELNCHTPTYFGPIGALAANPGIIGEIAAGTSAGRTLVFAPSR